MDAYVNHFLHRIRNDFPLVIVSGMDVDIIAAAKRLPGIWDGDLSAYRPKDAGGLHFNYNVSRPHHNLRPTVSS